MSASSAVVVSHSMPMVRQMCTMGAVLEHGHLSVYDNLEDAIAHHEAIMRATVNTPGE